MYCSVADAEERPRDGHAAEDAGQVADDRDADHHDRRREHARDDQEADRADRLGFQRLDLLGDDHRADLGGDARAGEAGQHDRRHQRAQLAEDRDGDDVGDAARGRRTRLRIGAICSARIAPMQKSTSMTIGMLLHADADHLRPRGSASRAAGRAGRTAPAATRRPVSQQQVAQRRR